MIQVIDVYPAHPDFLMPVLKEMQQVD